MPTHAAFVHAAESYNVNGGEIAYDVRQAFRAVYLAGQDAIDEGRRGAEVAQAKARIVKRGQ